MEADATMAASAPRASIRCASPGAMPSATGALVLMIAAVIATNYIPLSF